MKTPDGRPIIVLSIDDIDTTGQRTPSVNDLGLCLVLRKIINEGMTEPILVKELTGKRKGKYLIIDGMYRYTVMKLLGADMIEATTEPRPIDKEAMKAAGVI